MCFISFKTLIIILSQKFPFICKVIIVCKQIEFNWKFQLPTEWRFELPIEWLSIASLSEETSKLICIWPIFSAPRVVRGVKAHNHPAICVALPRKGASWLMATSV